MERELDIAVLGCGIGGLAAACLLRDQGHQVTIFDQFEKPEPVGAGLIIQPVGQDVLAQIGVLAAVRALGVRIDKLTGRNIRNRRIALHAHYDSRETGVHGISIHRGALFSLLLQAAKERQVELRPDHLVFDVNDLDQPYLRIEGNRQAGPYDLVIDATGAGSPISPLAPMELSYGALWTVVDLPDGERDLGNCLRQRYLGASTMAGVLPLGNLSNNPVSKVALFWSLKVSDYQRWREDDLEDWKAEANALWPDFGFLLDQISSHEQMTFAAYSHGSLNKMTRNKLVYLGDSAHRTSPQLGQGANMALLDASVLADAMAEMPLQKALKAYSKRRMLHVKTYQALSLVMTPMYQSDSALYALLRDYLITPFSHSFLGRRLTSRIINGNLVNPFGKRAKRSANPTTVQDTLRGPGE